MATDYTDPKLFSAASVLYDAELAMSRHYETLRASLTVANLGVVGATFAIGTSGTNKIGVAIVLLVFAITASILAARLSHAHWFHFQLASKMRGVVARHHEKTEEKLFVVRTSWGAATRVWHWIRHASLWIGMNFVPAFVAALWAALS